MKKSYDIFLEACVRFADKHGLDIETEYGSEIKKQIWNHFTEDIDCPEHLYNKCMKDKTLLKFATECVFKYNTLDDRTDFYLDETPK